MTTSNLRFPDRQVGNLIHSKIARNLLATSTRRAVSDARQEIVNLSAQVARLTLENAELKRMIEGLS